jgi:hypothetical protein
MRIERFAVLAFVVLSVMLIDSVGTGVEREI